MSVDSTQDTLEHIAKVQLYMQAQIMNLVIRRMVHDASKLVEPEKSGYDALQADIALCTVEYNTPEYKEMLDRHQDTIQHHYAHNDHHPNHWPHGITDMSFFSMLEMMADWKAASERTLNGSFEKSMAANIVRYQISPPLAQVMINTAKELGWM